MLSKRHQIIEAARTAILGITTLGGYNSNIQQVYRGLRYFDEITDDKFPCVCFAGLRETRENINKPQFRAKLTLTIAGYVKTEDATDSLQEALDDLIEDVTKALEQSRTFNNLTLWNEIQTIETDRGDLENHGAFAMEVVFHYAAAGTTP